MASAKKRFPRRTFFILAIIALSCVFLFCAVKLAAYFIESNRVADLYNDLAGSVDDLRATIDSSESSENDAPVPPVTGSEDTPAEPVILPEYQMVYDRNSDTVGWITIADTKINYPVMQTPDRPDYYLKRDFNKMGSDWGAIYAGEVFDINRPSDNITLYGHHMKDGSMFAGLDNFKTQGFWQTHSTFSFDTLYERHTYQIWAVFKTSGNGDGIPYHLFADAQNEEAFDRFVSSVKSAAFYETGITPEYGDKLLTLSTCEYTQENGRFVVCAVRIS